MTAMSLGAAVPSRARDSLVALRASNNFDILRLVAAFMVVYSHVLRIFDLGPCPVLVWSGYDDLATVGVITFFVISGFLVTRSLLSSPSVSSYLINRSVRIFPGLIVCMLWSVFVLGPLVTSLPLGEYFSSPRSWLYLLNILLFPLQTVLPGVFEGQPRPFTVNGSIWTLSIEFSAYLIAIALLFVRGRKWVYVAAFSVAVAAFFLAGFAANKTSALLYLTQNIDNNREDYFFWFYFQPVNAARFIAFFFIGALFNWIPQRWLRMDVAAVLVVVYIISFQSAAYFPVHFLALPYVIMTIGSQRWRISNLVQGLGDISYGIYIYSTPLQQMTYYYLHDKVSPVAGAWISVLFSITAGLLSWHLVEKPALRLKRYSIHGAHGRPSAAPPRPAQTGM
ncbi:acyltransferase family protein [Bordetella genomosp. 1]|nr:acyltransferase [Bordetella genomosp. 1]